MSTTVTYKGSTLTTVNNQTRTLKTAGKYMEGDVILTDVSSSGGYVMQDQDGFIVLPSNGGGSPSVGGLEYETGTWTPSEDVQYEWISFTNSHTEEPVFVMIEDSDISTVTAGSWTVCYISVWGSFYGATGSYSAMATRRYLSGTSHAGANSTIVSSSLDSWVTSSAFRPNGTGTGYYWRAGRTYKWIAVWAPTT